MTALRTTRWFSSDTTSVDSNRQEGHPLAARVLEFTKRPFGDSLCMVAPLGPKIEAAAIAIALRTVETPYQVVYASVKRHIVPKETAQGSQPILEFVVQDLEAALSSPLTRTKELASVAR